MPGKDRERSRNIYRVIEHTQWQERNLEIYTVRRRFLTQKSERLPACSIPASLALVLVWVHRGSDDMHVLTRRGGWGREDSGTWEVQVASLPPALICSLHGDFTSFVPPVTLFPLFWVPPVTLFHSFRQSLNST